MVLSETVFQSIFGVCLLDLQGTKDERREHPRADFGQRAPVFPLFHRTPGRAQLVIIRDMSVKGISILHSDPFKIGQRFVVDMSKFSGKTLGLRCQVTRCDAGGSGGAQFIIGAIYEAVLQTQEELTPAPEPAEVEIARPRIRPRREPVLTRLRRKFPQAEQLYFEYLHQYVSPYLPKPAEGELSRRLFDRRESN